MKGTVIKSTAACIAFALLAAQPAFCQQERTGRERDGFLGPVYAVRESVVYHSRKGTDPSIPASHTTSYYDKNGDLILQLDYEAGRMVRRRMFRHNGADEVIEKIEDGGWDASVDVVGPNPPPTGVVKHRLKFDANGNLIEGTRFSENGGLLDKTEFKRDHQGRLLEENVESVEGSWRSRKTKFSYSEGSQPVSSTYEAFPGHPVTDSYSYEFDSRTNWTRKQTRGSGSDIERTITYYAAESEHLAESAQGTAMPGELPSDPLQPRVPPPRPLVIRKSGGVLQASATRRVEPIYPLAARAAHITGSVVVEITIDHFGAVADATVVSGPLELQEAAVQSAKQWKFQPTALSGMLVNVIGTITFNFQM